MNEDGILAITKNPMPDNRYILPVRSCKNSWIWRIQWCANFDPSRQIWIGQESGSKGNCVDLPFSSSIIGRIGCVIHITYEHILIMRSDQCHDVAVLLLQEIVAYYVKISKTKIVEPVSKPCEKLGWITINHAVVPIKRRNTPLNSCSR